MPLKTCLECGQQISEQAPACPHCGKPNQPKKRGIAGLIVAMTIGGLVLLAAVATIRPDIGTDHDSILDDGAFLLKHPEYPAAIRAMVVKEGFECPALAQLWTRGDSPFGLKLEALCGPDDGSRGAFAPLHYSVYPARLRVDLCKPFGQFGGCD